MKKLILLLLLPFSVNLLFGQNYLLQGPTGTPANSNVYQDANGLIGIGNVVPAAHLDVPGGNGLSETPIPIIAPHYEGGMSPAPDYIIAWRDFLELGGGSTTVTDFNVNPIGEVGIGTPNVIGIAPMPIDLLIQSHGWAASGSYYGISATFDDNWGLLTVEVNSGNASYPSGGIGVFGNSNISTPALPALFVVDGGGNLSYPVLAVSGAGAIGMGTDGPEAQLDINNNTYTGSGPLDYLFHVGDANISKDYLTVANNADVEVGIGIVPTGFSTLAIQGSSLTMFDLFEQSGQQAGIRFYGSDGDQRHLIYDDVTGTGNLVLWPGVVEGTNTVEINGTTQVDVNLAVGGNAAITGNETVGGNAAVTGNATVAGTLAIGSVTTPSGYNLYVQNGILTEKVKVSLASDATDWSWPDYVFDKGHNMMKLQDLAKYIQKNKHLPEIPTADETVKNGIDLGEMDAKLLAKVEELTLYVIKQQQEIDALKKSLKTK